MKKLILSMFLLFMGTMISGIYSLKLDGMYRLVKLPDNSTILYYPDFVIVKKPGLIETQVTIYHNKIQTNLPKPIKKNVEGVFLVVVHKQPKEEPVCGFFPPEIVPVVDCLIAKKLIFTEVRRDRTESNNNDSDDEDKPNHFGSSLGFNTQSNQTCEQIIMDGYSAESAFNLGKDKDTLTIEERQRLEKMAHDRSIYHGDLK